MEIFASRGVDADVHPGRKAEIFRLRQESDERIYGDNPGNFGTVRAEIIDDDHIEIMSRLVENRCERRRQRFGAVVAQYDDRYRRRDHFVPGVGNERVTRHQTA